MSTSLCSGRAMLARASLLLLTLLLVIGLGNAPAHAGGTPTKMQRVERVNKVLDVARSLKGIPYHYGGTTRRGFDCSGYTRFVFAKIGERLPRTSGQQYVDARRVPKQDVQRGDLVFFLERGHVYHVGIYAGAMQIWHSPHTGARVRLERIWTSSWRAGRVVT